MTCKFYFLPRQKKNRSNDSSRCTKMSSFFLLLLSLLELSSRMYHARRLIHICLRQLLLPAPRQLLLIAIKNYLLLHAVKYIIQSIFFCVSALIHSRCINYEYISVWHRFDIFPFLNEDFFFWYSFAW